MKKNIQKIKIEFQHFDGCPNGPIMLSNLKEAIKEFQDIVEIEEIHIDTDELAKKYKFRGSPTLIINNNDFEDQPAPSNPMLSCRYYPHGLPTTGAIRSRIKEEISYFS